MRIEAAVIFFLLFGGISQSAQERAGKTPLQRHAALVRTAVAYASSQPVRSFAVARHEPFDFPFKIRDIGSGGPGFADRTLREEAAPARFSRIPMPRPLLSFDGLSNYDNIDAYGLVIIPPDTIGDVGPGHYVQAVNALLRVFGKSGNALTPPFKMSQLFAQLGTTCAARDDGQPNVLYDPLAGRWLLSQYCNAFPPFRQMIAVSKTEDPTGAYHLYEFVMPNFRLNDAAKFGVWPDAYYMSTEEFTGGDFSGLGAFAFDRAKMLEGDATAAYIYFGVPSASMTGRGNLLPADLDGLRPPPAAAPNIFIGFLATEYGEAVDAIRLFDFHADFADPLKSTFTERTESPLPVAAFDPTSPEGRQDIRQPPPGAMLDSNSDRLNYRAAYRNLGGQESIVVNQTVRLASDPYRSGIRVHELRRSGGSFAVTEQATLGNNLSSRWIASAAQDHRGNIALGYNRVADDTPPSLYFTGKLASDPTGVFREEEKLIEGTGVQKAFGFRWGDYSGMSVDPVDECTFWMTGEYYSLESQNFSDFTWLTRIGTFKFPECSPAPRARITGTVANAVTGGPVAGAYVAVGEWARQTSTNGSFGPLEVLPGTYSLTTRAIGYQTATFSVTTADGDNVLRNVLLRPIPVLRSVAAAVSNESCLANAAPDPGERVTVSIPLHNGGALATQELVAELLETSAVRSPSASASYGVVPVGATMTGLFSFTVSSTVACGDPITLTIRLRDAGQDLGIVELAMVTGTQKIAFRENFDRIRRAGLPQRWTRSTTGTGDRSWMISARRSESAPKAIFAPNINQVGISEIVTPAIPIASSSARVTFRNWYEFESTFLRNRLYDGSVMEIKIGDGEWSDIIAAGGVFEFGGYDGQLDACCQNPLAGRRGWSGRSGINATAEFISSAVKLPVTAAGHLIQLRWRVGTDIGGQREGQYIDDLTVTDGRTCGC